MAIKIYIKDPEKKEERVFQASVNLHARKTLDGNLMILDHKDIDIVVLIEKKKALDSERRKLQGSFKGKSKDEIKELVKSFRDAQKDKHEAIKQAQQELIKSIREKRQTGARRE